MTRTFTGQPGVDVITTTVAIPALGSVRVNAFVLHGSEPLLVDTGTVAGTDDFLAERSSRRWSTAATYRPLPARC